MRQSENYNLKLAEGTDVVNPLTIDVPNYEIIDEQMKKNENAGIPTATELLSGTVHAITRNNPNASMFRFVATSDYTMGDTFTVDGVPVTALLTTGESLKTGSYVINANVLCCLTGTVLTVFCGAVVTNVHAVDSDKLGGKDPNYYASHEGVAEMTSAANDALSAAELAVNKANRITQKEKTISLEPTEGVGSGQIYITKYHSGMICLNIKGFKLREKLASGANVVLATNDVDYNLNPGGLIAESVVIYNSCTCKLTFSSTGAITLYNLGTNGVPTTSSIDVTKFFMKEF